MPPAGLRRLEHDDRDATQSASQGPGTVGPKAGVLVPPIVEPVPPPIAVGHPGELRNGVCQRSELRLAFPQLPVCLFRSRAGLLGICKRLLQPVIQVFELCVLLCCRRVSGLFGRELTAAVFRLAAEREISGDFRVTDKRPARVPYRGEMAAADRSSMCRS
jgi:hypothetical protein